LILEWTYKMHLLCLISIAVALYEAISARGYQTKFKNYKIGLLEFSPFQITKLAQVFCWMNLAGKVWKNRLKWLAMIMYKIHNNLSPSYLRRIFNNTSNLHAHNLRKSEINCYVPNPRTLCAIEDLFCGTRFHRKSDTYLV